MFFSAILFVIITVVALFVLTYKFNINELFDKVILFKYAHENVLLMFYISLLYFKKKIIKNFNFLPKYYLRNENLWLDGFLFDFLQKKSTDLWIRKFVIYTGFIFSERLIFDSVIRLYLDNILWPSHYFGFLETSNILEMLLVNIYFYFLLFVILVLLYLCFI